jgi:hypothetical protein
LDNEKKEKIGISLADIWENIKIFAPICALAAYIGGLDIKLNSVKEIQNLHFNTLQREITTLQQQMNFYHGK